MNFCTIITCLLSCLCLLIQAQDDSPTKTVALEANKTIPSTPKTTVTQAANSISVSPIASSYPTPINNLETTDIAALDDSKSDPAAGFIKTCVAWQVWDANNYLWARCRASGRHGKFFWSRIGLDHMLGNVGGRLVYQKEGYFSSSCISCRPRPFTDTYFQCECPDSKGEFQLTSIDLNKYLGNRNGFICSEYMCGVREDPSPAAGQ
ncbi:CVNH domain-containing protein [Colletotrichum truncatum]|uniref:CVNH domain-containing protein n=1 Tax=Colletotrichum truncatum TaxID=5467 RepID=A0ACC3YYS7_COLTU|nr:CVNH domain-containing protein [Colletotrichum truncatum]KAF6781742.1 CVNH domain-containing protein [Colletotrichum truncatum]